jgi:hypothetical protein
MAGPALSRIALCTRCLDSGTEYVSDAGMRTVWVVLLASALLHTPCAHAVRDVSVPSACDASVNQRLADLLAQQPQGTVDNVMVCGVTVSPSRTQSGGPHGSHQILPLLVNVPGAGTKLIEVVTNDDLDGVVSAPKGAQVFAYGQAFFPSRGQFAAGIHDVHCATHRGADNGWVVVNGVKAPASCGPR